MESFKEIRKALKKWKHEFHVEQFLKLLDIIEDKLLAVADVDKNEKAHNSVKEPILTYL